MIPDAAPGSTNSRMNNRQCSTMATMGIDAGSTFTKVVIIDNECRILGAAMAASGISHRETTMELSREAAEQAHVSPHEIRRIVSTGYGRYLVGFDHQQVTEISCHAMGARWSFPKARLVIDIGGQDSKVIELGEDGRVINFAMNDKCAAGTGRFLENMARVLKMDLVEMGRKALEAKQAVSISSVCTVFAESEVISLLARGEKLDSIVAGIFESIGIRIKGLVNRCRVTGEIAMTGGVARNGAMVRALERLLDTRICVPAAPELAGAIGAALSARSSIDKGVTL